MSAKLIRVLARAATQGPMLALGLALVAAALALAGCAAVGPDFQRPELALDPAFMGTPNAQPTAAEDPDPWPSANPAQERCPPP